MTLKHSKSKDKTQAHKRRGKRKAIRCHGALMTPRRGLIFAQGRAIQQSIRENKLKLGRAVLTTCAGDETAPG